MDLFWLKGFNSTSIADILSAHAAPLRQPLSLLPRQAGCAGRGSGDLSRRNRGHAARARLGRGERSVDRIFALLKGYRTHLLETDCTYGCPIGSLALELHEPDRGVRELLAENFCNWVCAIEDCLTRARERLPAARSRPACACRIRAHDDGGRHHAGPHPSRRGLLRPHHLVFAYPFRHVGRQRRARACSN